MAATFKLTHYLGRSANDGDEGSRYDASRVGLFGCAAMTAILEILGTISTWPWPMLAAFLAAGSLGVIGHTQIVRPRIRRWKLKRPFRAHFLITPSSRLPLNYVLQDDDEHYVTDLVVPPNSEIPIQIVLEPRISFMQHEIYFGCDESLADEKKPRAVEYFVPFVREGVRRSGKPDAAHPGHYIDYNGFYHVRENFLYTRDCRVIGFKLQTQATGFYPAQIYTVTDDVRGRVDLTVRVEDPPKTKMRCHLKRHRIKGCFVTPIGLGAKK
jgi:hypothetical protein